MKRAAIESRRNQSEKEQRENRTIARLMRLITRDRQTTLFKSGIRGGRFDGNRTTNYENCSCVGHDACRFASQSGIGKLDRCGDCSAEETASPAGGKARQAAKADDGQRRPSAEGECQSRREG